MRRAAVALLGVALAGGTVLVLRRRNEGGRPVRAPVPGAPPTTTVAPTTPTGPAGRPQGLVGFSPRARAIVREAIDDYVAANGLEASVSRSDRRELVSALGRLRRSARRTQRARVVTPRLERRHLQAVLEAERLFHEKLGVGVSAFMAAQGAGGQVEDLGSTHQ